MNSTALLLLFVLVAVSIKVSQQAAAVPCFFHWTRAQNGTSGTQSFSGIVLTATTETYNNPLYYSLSAAQLGFTSSNIAKGRLSAALPTTTFKGPMTFDFFKGKDQIVIDFTKASNGGPILKGKGCYAKIKGNATRVQIGTTLPKVFEWKFCPTKKPKCVPK
jgi:hypothetical protein